MPWCVVRRSVSILCHTLSGNAFGRAWVLAQLLQEQFDVHIVTACRSGDEMWLPARGDCDFEIRRWQAFSYPGFLLRAPSIARRLVTGDLIYCVKPRLTSYGLGIVAKHTLDKPLLLDIDDNELGFSSLSQDLLTAPIALFSAAHPLHTRIASGLSAHADAITVSNRFLHARHGGCFIPHARDERIFAAHTLPRRSPSRRVREPELPSILFVGTPRGHKGLHDLLAAFRALSVPARLRIVGGTLDADFLREAEKLRAENVFVEPPVPMRELPELLACADVIAIPQQEGPASQGQLPAKLLDAMAAGKAIVSTRVGDIPYWLADGAGLVVNPNDVPALTGALDVLLSDPELREKMGSRARERFTRFGSLSIVRPRLCDLVERVLCGQRVLEDAAPFETGTPPTLVR